ncbi:MAG: hypothetical protein WCP20_22820, partial [Desulfuromonadales bacterium]
MPDKGLDKLLKRYGIVTISCWTVIICLLATLAIHYQHENTLKGAENEARDYFILNLFYRAWGAKMGGVYVPVDKVTPNCLHVCLFQKDGYHQQAVLHIPHF